MTSEPNQHVLARIIETQTVSDGTRDYPLGSHIDVGDGEFIQKITRELRPTVSLEVGMAYGISTLFICEVLAEIGAPTRHIVVDPFQHADWHGIGLRNVRNAGFERFIDFREERSEYILPRLAEAQQRLDMVLIDGWHSFDHVLVEFFYVSRMLQVGGVVIFDDSNWPSLNKLLRYLVRLPHFELYAAEERSVRSTGMGAVRRWVGDTSFGRTYLHPSFSTKPWELGISHRCVALRKTAEDTRDMKWFEDF